MKLAKVIIKKGLPKPVQQLLVYSTGIQLGKEKEGVPVHINRSMVILMV